MSEAEVHAAVRAEGLTLVSSSENKSGFKGVTASAGGSSRSQANYTVKGKLHCLGHFATALQAALCIARFLGPDGSAAAAVVATAATPQGMSEADVRAAAEAEDLTLVQCSDHQSGFKGVSTYGGRFQAGLRLKGKRHYFGTFVTALEAVTHFAVEHRRPNPNPNPDSNSNPNPKPHQRSMYPRV